MKAGKKALEAMHYSAVVIRPVTATVARTVTHYSRKHPDGGGRKTHMHGDMVGGQRRREPQRSTRPTMCELIRRHSRAVLGNGVKNNSPIRAAPVSSAVPGKEVGDTHSLANIVDGVPDVYQPVTWFGSYFAAEQLARLPTQGGSS